MRGLAGVRETRVTVSAILGHAVEIGLTTASDPEIMRAAAEVDRVLVTADSDFAAMLALAVGICGFESYQSIVGLRCRTAFYLAVKATAREREGVIARSAPLDSAKFAPHANSKTGVP
jgi:predicted nuclease of predicted toxin-antitoxin system